MTATFTRVGEQGPPPGALGNPYGGFMGGGLLGWGGPQRAMRQPLQNRDPRMGGHIGGYGGAPRSPAEVQQAGQGVGGLLSRYSQSAGGVQPVQAQAQSQAQQQMNIQKQQRQPYSPPQPMGSYQLQGGMASGQMVPPGAIGGSLGNPIYGPNGPQQGGGQPMQVGQGMGFAYDPSAGNYSNNVPGALGGPPAQGGGFLSRLSQQISQQQPYGGGFMPQQRSPWGGGFSPFGGGFSPMNRRFGGMMGGMSPYGFGGGMSPFMGGYNPFGGFGFGRMF